jgi:hypothetical protein
MSLALVHLVRKTNGVEPFRAFLESYEAVPAGADHDLVLLLKGFESERDAHDYVARAGANPVAKLLVPDEGFDVGAYFTAAERLEHERISFVNSFTSVRVPGWLGALDAAAREAGGGLAGATASCASHWSWLRYELGLPSVYAQIFTSRAAALEQMVQLAQAQGALIRRRTRAPLWRWLGAASRSPAFARNHDEFPAHHIRTNGFLLETAVMRSLAHGRIRTKVDAYRLEGGARSITRQVEALGLAAVVAGADGRVYGRDAWAESRTFWQGDQENRLLDDNQTRVYDGADAMLREFLTRFAWGEAASPSPAGAASMARKLVS